MCYLADFNDILCVVAEEVGLAANVLWPAIIANGQCPKVGDGVIGWHIMAVLTRRDSQREKDMPHERRYDFAAH